MEGKLFYKQIEIAVGRRIFRNVLYKVEVGDTSVDHDK